MLDIIELSGRTCDQDQTVWPLAIEFNNQGRKTFRCPATLNKQLTGIWVHKKKGVSTNFEGALRLLGQIFDALTHSLSHGRIDHSLCDLDRFIWNMNFAEGRFLLG